MHNLQNHLETMISASDEPSIVLDSEGRGRDLASRTGRLSLINSVSEQPLIS